MRSQITRRCDPAPLFVLLEKRLVQDSTAFMRHKTREDRQPTGTAVAANLEMAGASSRLFLVLPSLLAFLLYLPSLGAGLVWDDHTLFETQLPFFQSLQDVLSPPAGLRQWATSYYRPVITASHLAEIAWFGPRPARAAHAAVLVFHALTTLFATILAAQLLRGRRFGHWGAAAAGFAFAVHPLHTESVAWISGRSDVLSALFLFAGLSLALAARDSSARWPLVVSPILFFLALAAKETGFAGLLLLPFLLRWAPRREPAPESGGWGLFLTYVAAGATYLALRLAAGAESGVARALVGGPLDQVERLASAVAYYLLKTLVPWPQSALVTSLPPSVTTILVLLAAGVAVWLARRAWRAGERAWGIAWFWWAAALLPSLPIAVLRIAEAPVAERYLYLPSFALCLALGTLLARELERPQRRLVAIFGLGALLISGAGQSLSRQQVWNNDLSLWTHTVAQAPSSALAWTQLGNAHLDGGGDLTRAIAAYETALQLEDDARGRARTWNSLGVVRAKRGESQLALVAWRQAIAADPSYPQPHFNLGSFSVSQAEANSQQTGRFDEERMAEGERHLREAIRLDPRFRKALLRLASCRLQQGTYQLLSQEDRAAARSALEESRALARQSLALSSAGREGTMAQDLLRAAEQQLAR